MRIRLVGLRSSALDESHAVGNRYLPAHACVSSELQYLLKLAGELGFAKGQDSLSVQTQCEVVARQLQTLIERMEALAASEVTTDSPSRDRRPKTED